MKEWIDDWNHFVRDQKEKNFIIAEANRKILVDFLEENQADLSLAPVIKEYNRHMKLIKPEN